MNPLEYINFKKDDFVLNCTTENVFNDVQANEFFSIVCEYIERFKEARHSEKRTETVVDELIKLSEKWISEDSYWTANKYRLITHWLLKAIWEDKSYSYAKIRLGQHYNRKSSMLVYDVSSEIMSDKEIFELLKHEDLQEGVVSESKDEKLNEPATSVNGKEPIDNKLILISDPKTKIDPEKQFENQNHENKLNFNDLLTRIKFDKNEQTKEKVKVYLSQLNESATFKKTNRKEFTAVALIFFQTGWVTNIKSFNEWSIMFANTFGRKKSSYKPNQLKNQTGELKIKIPFLDDLPIQN